MINLLDLILPFLGHNLSKTYHSNMPVYIEDALIGPFFIEFRCNQLLHTKHDAILATDCYCRTANMYIHTVIPVN